MTAATEIHAAAMDRMYRLQRHFYDATRRYYLLGRDRLVHDLRVPVGGSVLEVGCGTGRNLVKVAEVYPEATIYGVDISSEMLKSAGNAVMRSADPRRFRLAQADAVSFDPARTFGVRQFDRVFFSYTLSMIPGWEQALLRAQSVLSPSGELHVADFGQCEELPVLFRRILFAWLKQFDVQPRRRLPEVFQSMSKSAGLDWRLDRFHRGYSWRLVARTAL